MRFVCSKSFYPLIEDQSPILFLYGGRGSGKSEFAGRKKVYRAYTEGGHNFMLIRKINLTIRGSMLPVILSALEDFGINYEHNKTNQEIIIDSITGNPSRIFFSGLDHWQKLKSIKGITGLWLEELTEFTRKDFMEIQLAFRDKTVNYKQTIASFNPDESLAPWIKEDYFDHIKPDVKVHHSTVYDNPIGHIRREYVKKINDMCAQDPIYKKIYMDGEWAVMKGIIFSWDVQELPPYDGYEIGYGGDFGFSIGEAGFVKVYRRENHYWLKEILFETGLTNQRMAEKLIAIEPDVKKIWSYWDAAEPKSIVELNDAGVRALPALKGPDSWRAGIDFMKSVYIHIIPPSPNLIREAKFYKNKQDKDGNILLPPEPLKYDDHLIDASRYFIFTTARHGRQSMFVLDRSVYPD